VNRVFIDTDVILDVLLAREPYKNAAIEIFKNIELKHIEAFTSPLVIANIAYILKKAASKKISLENVRRLHQLLKMTILDQKIMDNAIHNERIKDFEDLIQFYSAMDMGIDFLITRNVSDYPKTKKIRVISPEDYINLKEMKRSVE
jgi:predicted nucleic acid-binding protein